jgi:hypothetical protein
MNTALREAIFGFGPHIRYVAFGDGQHVETAQRDGIADASDTGSDFFEELLVNPALLTLARQRGDLDCGGLRHIIVGYGNFDQVVVPTPSGHRLGLRRARRRRGWRSPPGHRAPRASLTTSGSFPATAGALHAAVPRSRRTYPLTLPWAAAPRQKLHSKRGDTRAQPPMKGPSYVKGFSL